MASKSIIIDLEKCIDKEVRVTFQGGREVRGVLKGFDQLVNIPGVPATLPFTGSLQGVHLADDEDMTLRSWVASGGLKTTVPSLQLRLGRSKADNDGQAATLVRYAQGTAIIVVSVGLYALLTFA